MSGQLSGSFSDVRSSFTTQFLMAGAMQARAAAEIESSLPDTLTEDDKVAHRGFVIGAIMQPTAALGVRSGKQ